MISLAQQVEDIFLDAIHTSPARSELSSRDLWQPLLHELITSELEEKPRVECRLNVSNLLCPRVFNLTI